MPNNQTTGRKAFPGPFFFCGDVPEELRQAAQAMNMGAEFLGSNEVRPRCRNPAIAVSMFISENV